MKTFRYAVVFFSLLVLSTLALAGPVQQSDPGVFITIEEYVIKSSSLDGDSSQREISIVARNETDKTLNHVYLVVDGMPSHVNAEGQAYFPTLEPGTPTESNSSVNLSVDLSRQSDSILELIWQMRINLDGEQFIDEVSVTETLY